MHRLQASVRSFRVPPNPAQNDHKLQSDGSDGDILINDGAATPADWCRSQCRARSKLSSAVGLLAACAVGLLLMFPVCLRMRNNNVKGIQGRRLAEGGGKEEDDLTPPSTPERLDLCAELEDLLSGEPSNEALRASPLMIRSFFAQLEGGDGLHLGEGPPDSYNTALKERHKAFTSDSRMKRPASEETDNDAEIVVPSWRVGTLNPSELSPVPLLSSDGAPHSSSTAGPVANSGLHRDGDVVHPWVRVPHMKRGVTVPQLRAQSMALISTQPLSRSYNG
ncbi:hypothetical protein Esti_006258 [Eimeria stiedai]